MQTREPDYDPDYDAKQIYWVCAYANNQWKLDEELVDDLKQTSFRKALDNAEGTVTILDSGSVTFTRVWCCYEILVSLYESAHELCARQKRRALSHASDPSSTRPYRLPDAPSAGSTRCTRRSSTSGSAAVARSIAARQWA